MHILLYIEIADAYLPKIFQMYILAIVQSASVIPVSHRLTLASSANTSGCGNKWIFPPQHINQDEHGYDKKGLVRQWNEVVRENLELSLHIMVVFATVLDRRFKSTSGLEPPRCQIGFPGG